MSAFYLAGNSILTIRPKLSMISRNSFRRMGGVDQIPGPNRIAFICDELYSMFFFVNLTNFCLFENLTSFLGDPFCETLDVAKRIELSCAVEAE